MSDPTPAQTAAQENGDAYWRATLRLLAVVLVIWFAASFGAGIILAPFLNQFSLGGYPLGFWFAQQGSIFVFLILILGYAVAMNAIDRAYNVHED